MVNTVTSKIAVYYKLTHICIMDYKISNVRKENVEPKNIIEIPRIELVDFNIQSQHSTTESLTPYSLFSVP